uniref:Uncharacterized protein n=1 Tax=Neisseria meningitidis alpha522 TaxID=996307 RepID=I4E897_NEIME|nr:hypothetical protein NMALPHA522_2025 [Neisseria meningitidis alpha522]
MLIHYIFKTWKNKKHDQTVVLFQTKQVYFLCERI